MNNQSKENASCVTRLVQPTELLRPQEDAEVTKQLLEKLKTVKKESQYEDILKGSRLGLTAYQKPEFGIPKSDLDLSILQILAKAETALQNFQEKDPTVPDWAKQPRKPSYTAREIGALPVSTHIPKKLSELVDDIGLLTPEDIVGLSTAEFYSKEQIDEILLQYVKLIDAIQDSNYNHTDNNFTDYYKNQLDSTPLQWFGTIEEYNNIAEKDPNVLYLIYEE